MLLCNKFLIKLILIIFNKLNFFFLFILLLVVGVDYGKFCSDIYFGEWLFFEFEIYNLVMYMYFIRED